jgi:5-methylcytosine-specific restriction enzyme subunit McrC
MISEPRIIKLKEYETCSLAANELSEEVAQMLDSSFGKQVDVDPPSFKNNHSWGLTSQGWVGYIPLIDSLHLSLIPKVPIGNLFRMLEYAYRLDFKVLEGLADCESIADLYERLALILAKRVLDRLRKGIYRSYIHEEDSLPYIRGRVDVLSHIRNPLRIKLPCHFEEHTADLEENQILLWTLTKILQTGLCTQSLGAIRQARRALQGFANLHSFSPQSCVSRLYSRLNQDYEPMHALCRFFLENAGPTYRIGDRRMLPILVDMEKLFELFVVEWLSQNIPPQYQVCGQANVQFQMGQIVTIKIDITIEDFKEGGTCFVLDTKYKGAHQPSSSDIEQVVAYAEAKECRNAALIYPIALSSPVCGMWGKDIRIDTLIFSLDGDLEQAGARFLDQLMLRIEKSPGHFKLAKA